MAVLGERVERFVAGDPPSEDLLETMFALGAVIDPTVDLGESRRRFELLRSEMADCADAAGIVRALMRVGLGGRARFCWRSASPVHALLSGAGLPLTVGLLAVIAAPDRTSLRLVGMPFHVVIGCGEPDRFIDPVVPALCDPMALASMVEQYSSGRLNFDESMLTTMTSGDVVTRVFNNLENAANAGRDLPLLGLVRMARRVAGALESEQRPTQDTLHLLN